MAFRLERPRLLIDIRRVHGLDEITTVNGELAVGARVTHRRLELGVSPDPVGHLLGLAGRHIGHLPIRVRGTFGGSIAFADPSAEWCLLAVTLGARIGLASARGRRSVEAGDFFRTPLGTPFEPGDFFQTASSFGTALDQRRRRGGRDRDRPGFGLHGSAEYRRATAIDPVSDFHGSAEYRRAVA
jgi:carbon-monoxide dehydrogenase medium subunit